MYCLSKRVSDIRKTKMNLPFKPKSCIRPVKKNYLQSLVSSLCSQSHRPGGQQPRKTRTSPFCTVRENFANFAFAAQSAKRPLENAVRCTLCAERAGSESRPSIGMRPGCAPTAVRLQNRCKMSARALADFCARAKFARPCCCRGGASTVDSGAIRGLVMQVLLRRATGRGAHRLSLGATLGPIDLEAFKIDY